MQEKGKVFSIVRKSLPSLKMTAYRDFFEILRNLDLYDEARHNKSDYTYTLNGNLFEFISLDQPQKKRGARRDYLFCNEANELSWEDFFQLLVRTTGKIWIDYNPSDAFHWIYDKLLTRDDVTYIQSTYKDNPFLNASIVEEIERLQHTDEDYWRIYGLGERGMSRATIFQFGTMDVPENAKLLAYGLDFGFTNDPTALVAAYEHQGNLYFDELVYRTGMTNNDIANLFTSIGIDRRSEVYADSAEPKSIEELYRRGFNIKPTTKGPDSVNAGIDIMKRYKLFITPRSTNLEKEMRNYKWVEDKNGNLLNKPIDAFNHCFTGDTMISTLRGDVPIKDVTAWDMVLTSEGYRRVVCRFDNGFKQVNTYLMQFGTIVVELTCTESHKIKTTNGWKQIKDLKKGDVLYLHKSLTGSNTTYTQTNDTSVGAAKDFIGWSGSTTTVRYLKATTFTTLMATLKTMLLRTYNSLKRQSISKWKESFARKTKNGLKHFGELELSPQNLGTLLLKVLSGIVRTEKRLGSLVITKLLNVSNAERNTKPVTQELQSIVILTAKQRHYEQEEEVYDLMVDECHEYYANGVLVHNCIDAARYAIFSKKNNPNFGRYSVR